MNLSTTSVTWLRGLDARLTGGDDIDAAQAIDQLVECATQAPAGVEACRLLAARLAAAGSEIAADAVSILERLAGACPQVVGLDFPRVVLSRAEWVGGNLFLHCDVNPADPARRTSYRVVGAEPRVWDLTAVDGTTLEFVQSGVVVMMPLVSGPVEFVAGSY